MTSPLPLSCYFIFSSIKIFFFFFFFFFYFLLGGWHHSDRGARTNTGQGGHHGVHFGYFSCPQCTMMRRLSPSFKVFEEKILFSFFFFLFLFSKSPSSAAPKPPRVKEKGRRKEEGRKGRGVCFEGHSLFFGGTTKKRLLVKRFLGAGRPQALRSTCGGRWRGRTRRTPAWRSTSAGRWRGRQGWSHRSRRSTCAQGGRRS